MLAFAAVAFKQYIKLDNVRTSGLMTWEGVNLPLLPPLCCLLSPPAFCPAGGEQGHEHHPAPTQHLGQGAGPGGGGWPPDLKHRRGHWCEVALTEMGLLSVKSRLYKQAKLDNG